MKKIILSLLIPTLAYAAPAPIIYGPDNKGALLQKGLRFPQSSAPGSPASGYNYLYFKTDNNLYCKNSSGVETQISGASSSGDVVGPASSTNNAIALFDGTTGKLLKNSLVTVSGSTITGSLTGAASSNVLKAGDTMTGPLVNSVDGAASTPAIAVTGAPYSAGSATTNKPQVMIETSGATSTGWSASGTEIGVNSASGFTGNLIDLQKNGASRMKVDSTGKLTIRGDSGATQTFLGIQSPTSASIWNLSFWTTRNTFILDNSGTGFYYTSAATGYHGWGYNPPEPRWPFTFANSEASTSPGDMRTGTTSGSGKITPVMTTVNANSTAGNYGCWMNAGSGASSRTNGYACFYNDTHTANSEDAHFAIALSNGGTQAEKIRISKSGQVTFGGTAPTVGTCGTSPTITSPSSDQSGRLTIGTGGSATACTLTFAATWPNVPSCMIRNETTGESMAGVPSTTAVTFSRPGGGAFGASDTVAWICSGNF